MALEPITRQEQIIAGENLKPITRMERFLKEFGGGGSGGVSPEEVTTIVKEQFPGGVGYSETRDIEIYRNENPDDNDNFHHYSQLDVTGFIKLEHGQKYAIMWDDTRWEAVCVYASELYPDMGVTPDQDFLTLFFNGDMLNPDTSQPLVYIMEQAGATMFVSQYQHPDRFAIYLVGEDILIDKEYIPDGLGWDRVGKETAVVNEPMTLTWSGNPDEYVEVNGFVKVSDAVLTDEQIKSATITADGTSTALADVWDSMVDEGNVTEDYVVCADAAVVICKVACEVPRQGVYPQPGIYFLSLVEDCALTTTEPVKQHKVVTTPISEEYLPKVSDLSETWIADLKAALGI